MKGVFREDYTLRALEKKGRCYVLTSARSDRDL